MLSYIVALSTVLSVPNIKRGGGGEDSKRATDQLQLAVF